MDFQNRVGAKTGGGGVASWSESNRDRRERLRQLALETIDLNKVGLQQLPFLLCFKILTLTPGNVMSALFSFFELYLFGLFDLDSGNC